MRDFWQPRKYFGHGLVGTLINQILESAASIENEKILNSIFVFAIPKKVLLNKTKLMN
jgi:hypothetical protein